MITKFARLEFELFTKPSKLDFLRFHQKYTCKTKNIHVKRRPGSFFRQFCAENKKGDRIISDTMACEKTDNHVGYGSWKNLQRTDWHPGSSLFDKIARAVCRCGTLPRKELYETWEMAKRVRRRYRDCRIIDLACCHDLKDSSTDRLEGWMDNIIL